MLSYTTLNRALAAERERALHEKARDAWQRRQRGELQIRAADATDTAALARLARLDSGPLPSGSLIVAEDNGEIVAAMSLTDGTTIANPFRATSAIVAMLRLRAKQLAPRLRARPSRRRRRASTVTAS